MCQYSYDVFCNVYKAYKSHLFYTKCLGFKLSQNKDEFSAKQFKIGKFTMTELILSELHSPCVKNIRTLILS